MKQAKHYNLLLHLSGDDGELLNANLVRYAKLQGIPMTRLLLIGLAMHIERSGTGAGQPELIGQIADYLAKPRKNARRIEIV